MKILLVTLLAALCGLPAAAQTGMPKEPESVITTPSDPGMRTKPDPGMTTPSDKGSLITPPTTGNEEIAKSPPKNIDPKIDDATADIDRKNRRKSEDKQKAQ